VKNGKCSDKVHVTIYPCAHLSTMPFRHPSMLNHGTSWKQGGHLLMR